MRVAITGGKGGTGKSTIATALAVELSKRNNVLLFDADVDCPNDHLILSIKRKKVKDVYQPIPKFDLSKCRKCGICSNVCRENAIVFVKGRFPIFIPDQCTGCSACIIACPFGAINKDKKKIGEIYAGKLFLKEFNQKLDFISAESVIGVEEESPIINAMKDYLNAIETNYDFVLIDTSPGTHCNVISALQGCDLALAVTEPTPLGQHDLELSLRLLEKLKVPVKIVLNKSSAGNKKLIQNIAKRYKTEIIAEIPYKRKILEHYSKGIPVADNSIKKLGAFLCKE